MKMEVLKFKAGDIIEIDDGIESFRTKVDRIEKDRFNGIMVWFKDEKGVSYWLGENERGIKKIH